MKQLLYILLILTANVYCHAAKVTQMNDVQKMGLKGKVKSYAQYATIFENDTIKKDYLKKLTLFDEKGNKVESNTYNQKKQLIGRTKSRVSAKGKVLEEKVYNQNGDEAAKTDNQYDKKGRLLSSVKIDIKGDTLSCWSFTYDKKGRKLASVYKAKDKTINTTYVYDKKGNVAEMNIEQAPYLIRRESFAYDTEGRLAAWSKSNGKDSTITTETKYNAWGMQTDKRVFLNKELQEVYLFENDKRGNKTAIFHYNEAGNKGKDEALIDVEYFNYDANDNKTLRQKIKNGHTIEGEINEITYY